MTKIIFYDVEHGSCCHIITPLGKHILVDVGSKTDSSIVDHINRKYFGGYGGRIDQLIITHPHEDHIYDLPRLYQVLKPYALQRPTSAFDIHPSIDTPIHRQIAACANKMNAEYIFPVSTGMDPLNAAVNGGVYFDIIEPKDEWTTKDDLNTFSCVIILKVSGCKFVLTGDNPPYILREMMRTNYSGIREKVSNATVLLAPHHGRTGEFCKEFFDVVNPYLTVVSDKAIIHNTQEETAKLYKGRGANLYGMPRYVLTTRNDGTISFLIANNRCEVLLGKEDY